MEIDPGQVRLLRPTSGRFFTMLSAVAMTASRVSRCLEWIAISAPPQAFFLGVVAGMRRPSLAPISCRSKARVSITADGIIVSAVERAGLSTLNEGQQIEYEIEENRGKAREI
jgi:hypothetical protein